MRSKVQSGQSSSDTARKLSIWLLKHEITVIRVLMASLSLRSSGRTEAHTTRSKSSKNHVATYLKNDSSRTTQQLSNIGRKKRPRESADDKYSSLTKKKAKIAVEIFSSSEPLAKTREIVSSEANANSDVPHHRYSAAQPPKQAKATQRELLPQQPKKTIHQEKVVNGIKHELDRLHDRLAPSQDELLKDDRRKLRSQEGARFKSELSAYFPEYDEVIGNDPKEDRKFHALQLSLELLLTFPDLLNLETPLIIVDRAKSSKSQPSSRSPNDLGYPLKSFLDLLFYDVHKSPKADFSSLNGLDDEDELTEDFLALMHRKPERQEKTIRNTDKGRAQHEKDQVMRLLEGLQGHDWLRLMGVSGITDSKKKDYEPARAYFIKGCEAILEKFRLWREEEKRRKMAKDMAAVAQQDEEQEEMEEEHEIDEADDGNMSDGDPPDYSDVDASAARQLHDEAIARSAPLHASRRVSKRAKLELIPDAEQYMEKDFKSFFSKPHLRDQALGKTRRSARGVPAWGYPLPEVREGDFVLPEELRDEETLKAHARRKRRVRRGSSD